MPTARAPTRKRRHPCSYCVELKVILQDRVVLSNILLLYQVLSKELLSQGHISLELKSIHPEIDGVTLDEWLIASG